MSVGVPLFELGKNYTISMTPQDVNASTGVFSDNAVGAQTFNGLINEHDEDTTFIEDNISPTDCPNSNPVTYEQSSTLTIKEIATKYALGSASGNKLRKCLLVSLYQKIVVKIYDDSNVSRSGSSGLLTTATYYAKASNYGKNVPKTQVLQTGVFSKSPFLTAPAVGLRTRASPNPYESQRLGTGGRGFPG
jgi:hypothetical protein